MTSKELSITKHSQLISWEGKSLAFQVTKGKEEITLSTEEGDEFLFLSSYPIYNRNGDINNLRLFLNDTELKVISLKQTDDILSLIIKQ